MNRKTYIIILIVVVLMTCCASALLLANSKAIKRLFVNHVYDNREHFLSCEELPSRAEAMRIMEEHQEVIRKIEQVHPGFIDIEIDTTSCPGKADIVFMYPSHSDRLAIEELIDGDRFFGIPYRLRNY